MCSPLSSSASWGSIIATVRADRSAAAVPPRPTRASRPRSAIGVGAVTNFFDTLGIGSFATTTALFRAFKMVPDRIIPGTLNAGHTLPTVVQAFFYIAVIPVDVVTLISMIAAAVAGRVARRRHRRRVVEAQRADRDGLRAARGGDVLHDAQPRALPRRL